jgi:hypothetical protein
MKSIIFWDVTPCSLLRCNPPASKQVLAEIISSPPKMEVICSSETSVATQQTTLRHIPEDDTLHVLIVIRKQGIHLLLHNFTKTWGCAILLNWVLDNYGKESRTKKQSIS